jgi:hypothetical protein
LIDDYGEVSANLIVAHNLCCHYTNMNELTEAHGHAIQYLWRVIEVIINEGCKKLKVVSANKMNTGTKPGLEDMLVESFPPAANLETILKDYREVASSLIVAHNISCHYTVMSDLTERHEAAIQQLWFVIEAIIKAGREKNKVAK